MANGTLVRKVMLQIDADDGDTEAKLDRITEKADELKKLHPELSVKIDSAAASAKLGVLRQELKDVGKPVLADVKVDDAEAKAAIDDLELRLRRLRLEKQGIKVSIDTSGDELKIAELKAQLSSLGDEGGGGGGGGGGAQGWLIGAGITAALAALPALAAAGGAAAGIALGAGLLIGTSSVKGPLYAQFHSLTSGLLGEIRTAALPLVKPLGTAFAQIGTWAKALKPELTAVFGSLGPLVMPLTRGLEGLVSGVLPGFLRLMTAAKPAVAAVAGVMSGLGASIGGTLGQLAPAVKASSQFLSGLSAVIGALMPLVGQLANMLASSLGPWMSTIGSKVAPLLAQSVSEILQAVTPLLPGISQLTAELIEVGALGIATLAKPIAGLIGAFSSLAASALPPVIAGLQMTIGWLTTMANATSKVLGLLSHIPGLGFLSGAGGGISLPSVVMPAAASALGGSAAAAVGAGFAGWAAGDSGSASGYGGGGGGTTTADSAAKLGQQIGSGLALGLHQSSATVLSTAKTLGGDVASALAGGSITKAQAAALSQSIATQMHAALRQAIGQALDPGLQTELTATGKITKATLAALQQVWDAEKGGLISLPEASSLAKWVKADNARLVTLSKERSKITGEIIAVKAYASSTASATEGTYNLASAVGTNPNPAGVGSIIFSLRTDVTKIRKFGVDVKKLARDGLNKSYLQQLIAMGPDAGGALAAELVASGMGDIRQINQAESAITSASNALGGAAVSAEFTAGKQSGNAFVKQLQSQQAAINEVMAAAARHEVAVLRKELGAGAGAAQKVEIRLVGGDKAFRVWLKKMIRVTGGDVTVVGA
jgi:hypothetical protein